MSNLRVIERSEPRAPGPGGNPLNPRSAKRIAAFGTAVIVLLSILVIRLWFLQVVGGRDFEAQAVGNSVRTINIPAPRGEILDRNGEVLAGSRLAWDVVALPQDLDGDQGDRTLRRIARVLGEKPAKLRRLMASGKKRAPYKSVVLAADIGDDLRIPLTEKIRQFPGIRLERTFRRDYRYGTYLSQVLGFVGPITEDDIEEKRRQGYRNDAIVGRDGLEARYEEFLRGVDGERRVEVDAAGQPVGRGTVSERPFQAGLNLQTTIDINVQKALEDAVREQVRLKSRAGGGGVVLNARTGEVIALASYPGTTEPVPDRPGQIRPVSGKNREVYSRRLYNRALYSFPPASTFKPIVALTALNAGYITPDEYLRSPKTVDLYGFAFNNFRKISLPDMQIRRAIAMSSDTFFYQVGKRIQDRTDRVDRREGHTKLRAWAAELGLGQVTGIDLPDEQPGELPDREWKIRNVGERQRLGNVWLPGDTVNMSVGQGFLRATPLQMARAYAALLNGGHLLTPTVGMQVKDPKTDRQISDLEKGRPERDIRPVEPRVLETIRGGMHDVTSTPDGTAWPVFGGVGGLVSGKTGTAETQGNDHSWFIGYGPSDAPEYVVAIVIENAGLGTQSAAPAACQTMAVVLTYDPKRCGSGLRTTVSSD